MFSVEKCPRIVVVVSHVKFIPVDEGAPTIVNCSDNINHYVAPGATEATVDWTAPTALPGSATLTTDYEPGSSFNAGTSTLVNYTAIDDIGRTATCTFTVAVIGERTHCSGARL